MLGHGTRHSYNLVDYKLAKVPHKLQEVIIAEWFPTNIFSRSHYKQKTILGLVFQKIYVCFLPSYYTITRYNHLHSGRMHYYQTHGSSQGRRGLWATSPCFTPAHITITRYNQLYNAMYRYCGTTSSTTRCTDITLRDAFKIDLMDGFFQKKKK
jgi:hypothetical protein